ncbi:hypothetical protein AMS59_02940 [Lysinibacillus sp. FJAT-14745]|uniref:hypothetical protein n=1 Tax=Lysinibacillus sp. FJAT-14745 TaxID=1704289 RepID=UPI0006AB9908|nr:hypothetical protein [Lysinibacillus sp. FJAT-14745]KOP80364.1 hypothetical protein AMS59_02940 [Lysinibacillus sp. FJAT-14745]
MGVLCPCGVKVNAFKESNNVKFDGVNGTIKGNLTYLADICVTTLATSTLSLEFDDTETPNQFSFLFTANDITSVTCKREGQNCVVTVQGTGTIGENEFSFEAVFRDQVATAAKDNVQSFVINNFFNQNGAVPVTQGSIVALGCQSL